MTGLRWHGAVDDAVSAAVEHWLQVEDAARRPADGPRRRVARIDTPDGRALFVKQFLQGAGARRARERLKAWIGRSPAEREWRALTALAAVDARTVPRPLARGGLAGGDAIVVIEFVDGAPLLEALDAAPAARRALLRALGRRVADLHGAGWVHRDLHFGNVLVDDRGQPWLIDVQRARPSTRFADRARDLGILDSSLRSRLSIADRTRILDAAFARLPPPCDAQQARARVAAASRAWSLRHARSRARHSLRPVDDITRVRVVGWRGLRTAALAEPALAEIVSAHERALEEGGADVLDGGDRRAVTRARAPGIECVVKEIRTPGLVRAGLERLVSSPSHRAWQAAHALAAIDIACPQPYAVLTRIDGSAGARSLLVMEDLTHDSIHAGDASPRLGAAGRVRSLLDLVVRLHDFGVRHRDLKAGNVLLRLPAEPDATPQAVLLDLEDVRLPRRLSADGRMQALIQLNASIPDDLVPATRRRRALEQYARRHPFSRPLSDVRARIVAASRARRHRWTGSDCSDPAD